MNDIVWWNSIKTRVTLFTLAIFMISIWSLAAYVSSTLRRDMQRVMGEQQFSTVSIVAAEVNQALEDRLKVLKSVAGRMSPTVLASGASAKAFLEEQAGLLPLFNGGTFITGLDGTAIADFPVVAGRVGTNYMDRESISVPLRQGKAVIGSAYMGKTLKAPVFAMVVPVLDGQGEVVGTLVSTINLGLPNFLDKITNATYGKTGGYLLVENKNRLIVTATDKSRILTNLPAPGVNPEVDRFVGGFNGTVVYKNFQAVDVLASRMAVPVAGWGVVATIPTAEAFAPIYDMQHRVVVATMLLTILAGSLTWWWLKRQIAPILATAKMLAAQSQMEMATQPLPITSEDEIGELVVEFNRLTERLKAREDALRESEERYRSLVELTPQALVVHRDGKVLYVNPAAMKMFGAGSADELLGAPILEWVHPDFRQIILERIKYLSEHGGDARLFELKALKLDGVIMDLEVQGAVISYDGKPAVQSVMNNITERKKAEAFLQASLRLRQYGLGHSLEELLTQTLDEAELLTGSEIGFFHFLEADQKTLWLQDWSTRTLREMCTADGKMQHYSVDQAGVWVDCIHERRPVIHNDYPSLAHRKGLPAGHAPVRRELVVPILRGELIVGILGVGNKPANYDQSDVETVSRLADIAWDVVAARRAEHALLQSRNLLAETERIGKVGGWAFDIDSEKQTWTEEVYRIHEVDSDLGPTVEKGINFYAPDCRALVQEAVRRAVDHGQPFDIESAIITAKGNRRDVHAIGRADLEHRRIYGFIQDITERKRAERERKRLLAIIEDAPDFIATSNMQAHLKYMNRAGARLVGLAEDVDLSALEIKDMHPQWATRLVMEEGIPAVLKQGFWHGETALLHRDGHETPVSQVLMVHRDEHGNPELLSTIMRDITQRKLAEQALQESQGRLARAEAIANVGNWSYEVAGAAIEWSNELWRIFGREPHSVELNYDTFTSWIREDFRAYHADCMRRMLELRPGQTIKDIVYCLVRPDGEQRWTETFMETEFDAEGRPLRFFGVARDITERRMAEQALRSSEERLRLSESQMAASQQIGGTGSWVYDIASNAMRPSAHGLALFGFPPVVRDYPLEDFLACIEDRDRVGQILAAGISDGMTHEVEYVIKPADGSSPKVIYSVGRLEKDTQGKPLRVLGFIQDITERRNAHAKLQIAAKVFSHALEGVTITDPDGTIIDVNESFTRITGYDREEVLGQNPRILQSGRQTEGFYIALWRDLLATGQWSGEIWNKRKNGEIYAALLNISAVTDDQGIVGQYVGLFTDITTRKQMEDKVNQLAFFDPLTKLPNRRTLNDRLSQAMASSKRGGRYGALMLLDLDNFKPLNDTHGHGAGDLLLEAVAGRMMACVREVDTVARIGGDEFVVLLSELDLDKTESISQARSIAEKIRIALAATYSLPLTRHGQEASAVEHRCTASIGVVLFLNHDARQEDILRWADAAMYQAKAAGRNAIRFHGADGIA